MHSSVETRYPFLDDDVIKFCADIAPEYKLKGRTEKWILRQVAAKTLPKQIANRPKTMFRSRFSKTFLDTVHPTWVDQLLSPDSLRKTGYFDPEMVKREKMKQQALPRVTPRRFVMDIALTCVVSTQLWHHLFFGGLCDLPTWSPPRIDESSPTNGHFDRSRAGVG
jgi:asparagine synthase (glutamine-hydrolysing)